MNSGQQLLQNLSSRMGGNVHQNHFINQMQGGNFPNIGGQGSGGNQMVLNSLLNKATGGVGGQNYNMMNNNMRPFSPAPNSINNPLKPQANNSQFAQ